MMSGHACIEAPAWQTSAMDPAGTRSPARLGFDAAIFDLDGVVTQTVRLHALAWKQTFDDFLRRRAEAQNGSSRSSGSLEPFEPFSIETDYAEYVDGRPRADGVRCFLASRGIELPDGNAYDPAMAMTVSGLGNRKNQLFHELLQEGGVEVYEPAVRMVRTLRRRGVRVAVATSSRNGKTVLAAAMLADLFDVRVDGELAAELGLAGKPSPDTFLESARRLGVEPRNAVLFEDALAGVEAGQRGGFGLVVGVDRSGQSGALRESGADVVISSFEDVTPEILDRWFAQNTRGLPPALACWPELTARMRGRQLVVFLDYDGTLAPIVENPDRAFLPAATREVVRALAARCPVAVVSGRGRDKVTELVALDELYYAGSHGFDISGPRAEIRWQPDAGLLDHMARASARLREVLADIAGVRIEEKGFSTAVHYRQVAPVHVPQIERRVEQVLAGEPDLQKTHGKKVLELRPRIDWHKGRAVLWLLQALGLDGDDVLPIYVGDDVTDEDAFEALHGRGLGILVTERPRPTAAEYAVRDCDEVRELLARLVAYLDAAGAR
jgi:trehalose 6-phosphate phosphatase